MAGTKRLFIAVPIDQRAKRQLVAAQQRIDTQGVKVRWTREDQLHLTLKFLGDTPDAGMPGIAQALAGVARRCAPLTVTVAAGGCFPLHGPVRVLWIGGVDPDGALANVVQQLEESIGPLGFPPDDRTFSIHFTLGRVNWDSSRGRLRDELSGLRPLDHHLAVRELRLYESRLSSSGSSYEVLCREPLVGC